MEIFNLILNNINNVLCTIVGIAFGFQIIYLLLFFLPAKKYPKAKEKHKVGVIICAKDEAEVIGRTIKCLNNLNYPKNKYEIIVMADNCTDNTADIARSLSGEVKVKVVERHEKDKKKHTVGWALNYLFEQIKDEIENFEFFVRFDADNVPDKDYLNKMNDAFEAGAKLAKGYNHATNLTQNVISGVSGLWYIRDSRFNCQARSALHTDVFLLGGGMMFSAEVIKEDKGWHATGISEDTEFTIWNMDKKRKIEYVPQAIVYEDQPSTLNDLYRRNVRMGNGLHKLFWTKGLKCLFKFFTTFRYCYLDMFLNLLFIPIAILCCTWIPVFYIYSIVYNAVIGNIALLNQILITIAIVLTCVFALPFILQALLVYVLDRKKIGQPFRNVIKPVLAFPMFMIIYAIGIVFGAMSKPKWKKAKRNVDYKCEQFDTLLNEKNNPVEVFDAEAVPVQAEPIQENDETIEI